MPSGHLDRRKELLAAWERRSRARGGSDHCTGADALFLVTALSTALRRSSETPELGRAARTWGVRFAAPVEALASLGVLRDALVELAEESTGALPVPLDVLNRVFDQAGLEAVDAASANLRSEARNDPLTGCANRRALEEDLVHALSSARRSNLDLAVAVVDLDGLKQINDSKGHGAGDAALISLVGTLRGALREADTLYRTGGDEFVVVAPFTDAAGARALMRRAERIGGPQFSWGVASLAGLAVVPAGDPAILMEAADSDLYLRRRSNRDAAIQATRRRRATAAVSVAASVAVAASMGGLVLALDSGASTPAAHQAGAAGNPQGSAQDRSARWPGGAVRPQADAPRSPAIAGHAKGSPGTDLAGLLGAAVTAAPGASPPPAPAPVSATVIPPAGPSGPSSPVGTVTVTLVSNVTSTHPVALTSGPSGQGPAGPGSTASAITRLALGPSPSVATAPVSGHGNGSGGGSGSGNANGAAKGHGAVRPGRGPKP